MPETLRTPPTVRPSPCPCFWTRLAEVEAMKPLVLRFHSRLRRQTQRPISSAELLPQVGILRYEGQSVRTYASISVEESRAPPSLCHRTYTASQFLIPRLNSEAEVSSCDTSANVALPFALGLRSARINSSSDSIGRGKPLSASGDACALNALFTNSLSVATVADPGTVTNTLVL